MTSAHPTMDPTFYRSPGEAIAAPTEGLAYVVAFDRAGERPDAPGGVDADPSSAAYGSVVGWTELTTVGDELHHFGWNACSSALMRSEEHTSELQSRRERVSRLLR